MKYVKRPVEVEAYRYELDKTPAWALGDKPLGVCVGDYIVKGINAEVYSVKAEIFEKTYSRVIES